MSFLQQLIQLLSEAPGSIVYHMVTLLAVQATLGLALWQVRRNSADRLAQRMVWAAGGILVARLTIIFAIWLSTDPHLAAGILPPLEQAIDSITVAIIVWAFSPSLPGMPRLNDMVLVIVMLFTGFMYAFFAQAWMQLVNEGITAANYTTSPQANVWNIFQLSILAIGGVLVLVGRQSQWVLRLAVLVILFLAHAVQLFFAQTTTILADSEIGFWVRLGNLFAFPLLAVLIHRHNLVQLLVDQITFQTSTERLAQHLELSRSVIDSLDVNHALSKGLQMAVDLIKAEFTALAVISLNDKDHLHLISTKPAAAGNQLRQQSWALNLGDWPAIRLAMQQRQRVELIPNGLGARQLHDIYQELGIQGFGSLLIEPLLVSEAELGVLLLAGPVEQERWPAEDKALSLIVASFLAQAIHNVHQYQRALEDNSTISTADETVVSGRLITLEEERDRTLAELESLKSRWQHSESILAAESQRTRDLAAALEAADQFNRDEKIKELEEEVEALRESLIEAEEAMALAAAGEGGLSPDWVMLAITRYSGEIEDAQARIQLLESKLAQQEDAETRSLIVSLAQELRTPLTSLAGYTDLLLNESMGILGVKQMSLMRRVKANIEHMSGLLDQIIQLTRQSHSPLANQSPVDIREAIETAINAVSSKVREKSLRLDLNLADNLPPVPSEGDAFYQIVAHLLNNACQVSMTDGRIMISAHHDTIQEKSLDGDVALFDFLHLAVTDSGQGLSREIHSLVLEAHRRPDEMKSSKMNDVGHSLSTAVSLVQAHGGRVWLSNELDVGDTLSVLLPLASNGYANGKLG